MRCSWAERSDAERIYHDTEWGVPVHDDVLLFERLSLRGAQAGLAWRTVLAKRDSYRRIFHGFDIHRVAAMTDADLSLILGDRGVIRHRLKVESIRSNAQAALRVIAEEGSLSTYLWSFVGGVTCINAWACDGEVPGSSDVSDRMSLALRRRGFRFAGTAICYAMMQSTGMVNDHVIDCERYR
jgi:DNA-3-methyladenine glycosylase I